MAKPNHTLQRVWRPVSYASTTVLEQTWRLEPKGYGHPPCIDLDRAILGFNIDNSAAFQAIEDSKALHARRWQTKEGTYRIKRPCLMYETRLSRMIMQLPPAQMANRDGDAGMETMRWDINIIPNELDNGYLMLPPGVLHMSALGRFGRFTLFSPRVSGEDVEDVKQKWEDKKHYFEQYKKDGACPPGIDLDRATLGFNIDNTAAFQAIEDSKALHARRWQTKEGTYRIKRRALPDVRDEPLQDVNAAASCSDDRPRWRCWDGDFAMGVQHHT